MKKISKKEGMKFGLLSCSVLVMIIGIMFLLTAMEAVIIFPSFSTISNVLAKYVVVILVMATGIMSFSNFALLFEDKKLRNGLTIFITTLSTILTVPLVYVFVAIFPANLGIVGPVGGVMMLPDIVAGFHAWFGAGAGIYVIYALMFILSVIFIAFPIVTGVLAVKGKTIKVGKRANGKFGVEIAPLPVVAKQEASQEPAMDQDLAIASDEIE